MNHKDREVVLAELMQAVQHAFLHFILLR